MSGHRTDGLKARNSGPGSTGSRVDEGRLVRACQAGELRAFEALVASHRNQVFRVAYQIVGDEEEAKDIAQVAFIRAWQGLSRFREGGSFAAWISRIAVNLAIDFCRKRKRRDRAGLVREPDWERVPSPGTAQPSVQGQEVGKIFRHLSQGLSPRQRAAFVLREIEGFTTEEVSGILGTRASTVRNHVHAARKTLQAGLRRLFPEYARGGNPDEGQK